MEGKKHPGRAIWLRALGAAAGALALAVLTLASPANAAVDSVQAGDSVQVEAVSSDSPVRVGDLATPQGVTTTYYCAVRDGTYGCQSGSPGDGLVVARLYQHANFNQNANGWMVEIFNPAYQVGCSSSTTDNEGGAPLGSALANAVSSVRTYNSCDVRLFNGSSGSGWIDADGSLGSWDNVADSFRIS